MMQTKFLTLTAIAVATLAIPMTQALAEDIPQRPAPEAAQNAVPDAPPSEAAPPEAAPPESSADGQGGPRADKFEKRGREMFEKTDTDKDGFISKEEMEASQRERMEEMFTRTDADKDGKLSPDELRKGREAMREKFRQRFKDHREGQGEGGALKDRLMSRERPTE